MEILTKDFVEFIECCVAREVKFLIVGGYALAAQPTAAGAPRHRPAVVFVHSGGLMSGPVTD